MFSKGKISKKDLSCVFPDYKGGNDFQIGIEFIKNKYQSCVKNSERMKTFVINAMDEDSVINAFEVSQKFFQNFKRS
jgi:hypothetical protein